MKLTKPEAIKTFKPKKVIKTAKELEELFSDNIYEAINNVRENHMSYGESPKKPCLHYKHSSIEAKEYTVKLEVYENEMISFKALKDEYQKFNNECNDELEKYLKEISGFFNYVPKDKQDKVWSKAWSDGHSDGYGQVYQCLIGLVELFI